MVHEVHATVRLAEAVFRSKSRAEGVGELYHVRWAGHGQVRETTFRITSHDNQPAIRQNSSLCD